MAKIEKKKTDKKQFTKKHHEKPKTEQNGPNKILGSISRAL